MEEEAGRPLFQRRRKGARPTEAGLLLAELAERMESAAQGFARVLTGLSAQANRPVSIAASEGIIAYLLAPALLHASAGPLESVAKTDLEIPSLTFMAEERAHEADISLLTLAPGELPSSRASLRVRRIGTMHFTAVASRSYLDRRGSPTSFEDIRNHHILDHSRYRTDHGLRPWNDLVSDLPNGPLLVVDTTSGFYMPLVSGCGLTLLPTYAPLYEPSLISLDIPIPDMRIELWLAAHEDSLREPAVRAVYDTVADMFLRSPWFR